MAQLTLLSAALATLSTTNIRRPGRLGGHYFFTLCCLVLLTGPFGAQAGPTTRTIDDKEGDSVTGVVPVYQPVDGWAVGSTCQTCVLKPDPARTFADSWMDMTIHPGEFKNLIMTFTGTSVHVYGILPRHVDNAVVVNTNVTFTLDGTLSDSFTHPGLDASDSDAFLYNHSMYSVSGLSNTQHTLIITPQPTSVFLFDYAAYTAEDVTPTILPVVITSIPSPSATNSAAVSGRSVSVVAIVGGVIGGLLFLFALVLLAIWWSRRRRTQGVDHIEAKISASQRAPPLTVLLNGRVASPNMSYKNEVVHVAPLANSSLDTSSRSVIPSLSYAGMVPSKNGTIIMSSARSSLDTSSKSVTPSLSYARAAPSNAPTKMNTQEAELERQLAVARATLDSQSSNASLTRNLSIVTTFKRSTLSNANETQLHARINDLQEEVDRLRANSSRVDAPPAYV